MKREEIKQLFLNNFDCYADVDVVAAIDIPAMTQDKFIEVVASLSPSPQPTSEAEGMTVGIDIKALKKHLEETPLEQLQDEWAQFVKDWPSSPQPSATAEEKSLIGNILLDISIDVQNELLRQCKKAKCDDCQTDNINENTIAVFELNKQKYISRLHTALNPVTQPSATAVWVSVKDRLPKSNYRFPVKEKGGRYNTSTYRKGNPKSERYWNETVEFWLEEYAAKLVAEREVPSDEDIEIQFPCEVGQYVKSERDMTYAEIIQANYHRRQGAKWMREFIKERNQ